mmetsp:Transcript_20608/g.26558  ORF Transcript_20608/g.26558 Transcript_20608/m.26558 type:complete len:278 (+) Transcript_20608:135-968(+)
MNRLPKSRDLSTVYHSLVRRQSLPERGLSVRPLSHVSASPAETNTHNDPSFSRQQSRSLAERNIYNHTSSLVRNPVISFNQPSKSNVFDSPYQQRSMVMVSKHKAEDPIEPIPTPKAATSIADSSSSNSLALPINNEKFPVENGQMDNLLIMTDSFWAQLERLATKKGYDMDKVYLRVFVDAGGCSGFTYQFEFHSVDDAEDTIDDEKEDLVWVGPGGARGVVDIGSMAFLRGATVDYVVEMIKSSFEISHNPQSESACGCGSSFALKNFSSNPALD